MAKVNKAAIEKQVKSLEKKIIQSKIKLNKLRHQVPSMEVQDYILRDWSNKPVKLSSLFGKKKDLILVHNMGKACTYCTLWADGLNGFVKPLNDRAAFAVVSPDDYRTQKKFALSRGWKFRMLSAKGSAFTFDMGFQSQEGNPWPGVSTFYKEKGKIYRISNSWFGPGDDFCSVWPLLDLLKNGPDGWEPKYKYR